jgi:hypothetical protein
MDRVSLVAVALMVGFFLGSWFTASSDAPSAPPSLALKAVSAAPAAPSRPALSAGVGLQVPSWALQNSSARAKVGNFKDQYTELVSPQEHGDWVKFMLAGGHTARAQGEEDLYAYRTFFWGMQGGVIAEVGALDGRTFSTTWYFAYVHGWYAVHVEASPMNFARLTGKAAYDGYRGRPESLNVHAALCSEGGQVLHYAEKAGKAHAINGIWEFMALEHRERWWGELVSSPALVAQLPAVTCTPPASIFLAHDIPRINLWVVDVEGAELSVLQTHDFEAVPADVLCVEAMGFEAEKNRGVQVFLESKGYRLHSAYPSDGTPRNEWFVHRSFTPRSKP